MILYMLEWNNGLDFDDYEVTLLGIYTTPEARLAAKISYKEMADTREYWPFCGSGKGYFNEYELEADTYLITNPNLILSKQHKAIQT